MIDEINKDELLIWKELRSTYLTVLLKESLNNKNNILLESLISSIKNMEYTDYRSIDILINSMDKYIDNFDKKNKDYKDYLSLVRKDNLLKNYEDKIKTIMLSLKEKLPEYLEDINTNGDILSSLNRVLERLKSLNIYKLKPVIDNLESTISNYESKLKILKDKQELVHKLGQLTLSKLEERKNTLENKIAKEKRKDDTFSIKEEEELLRFYDLEIKRRKGYSLNEIPKKEYEELKNKHLNNKSILERVAIIKNDSSDDSKINISTSGIEGTISKISNKLPDDNVFSSSINDLKNRLNNKDITIYVDDTIMSVESVGLK